MANQEILCQNIFKQVVGFLSHLSGHQVSATGNQETTYYCAEICRHWERAKPWKTRSYAREYSGQDAYFFPWPSDVGSGELAIQSPHTDSSVWGENNLMRKSLNRYSVWYFASTSWWLEQHFPKLEMCCFTTACFLLYKQYYSSHFRHLTL